MGTQEAASGTRVLRNSHPTPSPGRMEWKETPGITPRCSEILLEWERGEIVQEQQGKAQLKLLVLNQALVLHGLAGRDRTIAYWS